MNKDINWYWNEVKKVFRDDEHMVDHTQKVYTYAQEILSGQPEMSTEEKRTASIAALLHDIGILEAEKKHGSRMGKYQHIEGPPLVRQIMEKAGELNGTIDRVAFIVGNHHNFKRVDGIDFQVLIEADMLVNLQKENIRKEKLEEFINNFFKTKRGKELAQPLYLKKREPTG
ncbi:MAG TPA: phosphohydrolase [Candidatus Atribacteria bacterium]|nr:phosphohydrolase [Candidatus Atribacteria bacterium]HCU22662.1 phosphohydrolase [Candidatus Atribacteria bacterium]